MHRSVDTVVRTPGSNSPPCGKKSRPDGKKPAVIRRTRQEGGRSRPVPPDIKEIHFAQQGCQSPWPSAVATENAASETIPEAWAQARARGAPSAIAPQEMKPDERVRNPLRGTQ